MPQAVIDAIAPLIALLGVGTFTLIGMKMWLTARTERLKHQSAGADFERLADSVSELQDQLVAARDDIAELHERLDFTERVLASGKDHEHPDQPGEREGSRHG